MKHRLLQACFLLFLALLAAPLGAQNAPVKVDVNLLRPSVYANDLAEPGAAIVTITLLDNRPSYRGILNLTLSNNSGQSVTTPLTAELEVNLISGVPIVLTGSRLAPFVRLLGADAGAGLTDNGIVLAEGEQQLCALVFDPLFLGQPISNQDLNCSFGFAELHEPPTPISPIDEEVAIDPLQDAVNFIWAPNYFAGPVINYLTIWDVPREWAGVTPDIIINSLEPVRQPLRVNELNALNKLWTTGDADLIPGHRYLYQIQATDPTGRIRFRNNGYSRPVFFEYTYPTPSSDQLCYEPAELALTDNNGNYQLNWTGYVLDSVNHTVSVVTLPERRFVLQSALLTTTTFPTRQLINGGPQASFSYAINADLDTTNRQAYLVTLCTVCSLTGEEFCREVVLGTPGEAGAEDDLNATDSTLVCGLYPAPQLSVAELTATSALANWELLDDFAGSFVLRWSASGDAAIAADSVLLSTEQRSHRSTGLSAATDYTFTLCIVCPDGARTCYDQQVTTPADGTVGCDNLSPNLAATDVGFDQISLTWSAIENVSYAMAFAEVGTGPADDFFEVSDGAHTLSGLFPLTTYEVILRLNCAENLRYDTLQITTTNVGCSDAGEYSYDYECGAPGGIDSLDMGTPITHLAPGDTIWAGDFLVQVGEANAVGTQFGGYGFTKIPALGGAKLRLEFRAVEVNENCRMVAGEMVVVSPVRSTLEQVRELVAGFNDVMDDLVGILGQTSAVLGMIQETLNELADDVENQDAINELLDAANEAITQIPFMSEDLLQDLEAAEDCIRRATRSGDQEALAACTTQYNAVLAEISAYTEELFNAPFRVDFSAVENQAETYGFDVQQYASISRPYVTHQIAGTEYKVPWASTALEETDRGNQFVARRPDQGVLDSIYFVDSEANSIAGWSFNAGRTEAVHRSLEASRHKEVRHVFAAIPRDTAGGKPPVRLAGQLSIVSYNTEKVTVHLVPVNNAKIAGDHAFLQQRMNEIFHPAVVEISLIVEPALSAPDFSGTLQDIENHPLSNYTPEMLGLRRLVRQQDYHDGDHYYLLVVEGMSPSEREGFMPRKRHYGFLNAAALGSPEETARVAAHELGHGAWHLQHPFQQFPGAQQGATDNLMDYGDGVGVVRYQWGEVHDPVGNFSLFDEVEEGEYVYITDTYITNTLKPFNNSETYTFLNPLGERVIIDTGAVVDLVFATSGEKFIDSDQFIPVGSLVGFSLRRENGVNPQVFITCGDGNYYLQASIYKSAQEALQETVQNLNCTAKRKQDGSIDSTSFYSPQLDNQSAPILVRYVPESFASYINTIRVENYQKPQEISFDAFFEYFFVPDESAPFPGAYKSTGIFTLSDYNLGVGLTDEFYDNEYGVFLESVDFVSGSLLDRDNPSSFYVGALALRFYENKQWIRSCNATESPGMVLRAMLDHVNQYGNIGPRVPQFDQYSPLTTIVVNEILPTLTQRTGVLTGLQVAQAYNMVEQIANRSNRVTDYQSQIDDLPITDAAVNRWLDLLTLPKNRLYQCEWELITIPIDKIKFIVKTILNSGFELKQFAYYGEDRVEEAIIDLINRVKEDEAADFLNWMIAERLPNQNNEPVWQELIDRVDQALIQLYDDDNPRKLLNEITRLSSAAANQPGNNYSDEAARLNRWLDSEIGQALSDEDIYFGTERILPYHYTKFIARVGYNTYFSLRSQIDVFSYPFMDEPWDSWLNYTNTTTEVDSESGLITLSHRVRQEWSTLPIEATPTIDNINPFELIYLDPSSTYRGTKEYTASPKLLPACILYYLENTASAETLNDAVVTSLDVASLAIPASALLKVSKVGKMLYYADKASSVLSLSATILDGTQPEDPDIQQTINVLNLGSAATGLMALSGEGLLNLRGGSRFRAIAQMVDVAETGRSPSQIADAISAMAIAVDNLDATTLVYIAQNEQRAEALRGIFRRELSELAEVGAADAVVTTNASRAQRRIYEATDAYRRLSAAGVPDADIIIAFENLPYNLFRNFADDLVNGSDELRSFFDRRERVKAWEALPAGLRTKVFWLEQTDRWFGHGVSFTKSATRTNFKSPSGELIAYVEGDALYYRYDGFGGDVRVKPDKRTLVLGRVNEDRENPASQGIWRFLHKDRGFSEPGIPDGVVNRAIGGSPKNNQPTFLDLPDPEYYTLINSSIKPLIQNHPSFSGDVTALSLIADQPYWSGEVLSITLENNLLPGLSTVQIQRLINDGVVDGNEVFWVTHNHPLLIYAFEHGDDIRLVSDPKDYRGGGSVYARELQTIEEGTDELEALMIEHNYIYNSITSTYEKQ